MRRPAIRIRQFYAIAACCLLGASSLEAAAPQQKLNVLLIVSDDLRDHLGCYGRAAVKTPNIDRLAARGVLFERAYVQYPVCNPSRSSFLTGLRPDQTGVVDNEILLRDKLPNVVTLPQLLKDNGWHTVAFGKIFHLGGKRNTELRRQFIDLQKSWDSAEIFDPTPLGQMKLAGRNLTGGAQPWCHWGSMDGGDDDQPDGQVAKATSERIERLGEQPWMIGVGFTKPHDPFVAPHKYFDLYPAESLQLYRDPAGITPAPPLAVGFGELGREFRKFSDRERGEFLRAYYACTSFMDAQVGRVLDTLDRRKLWDRTIVIFISDHGYHLGEREWWNKNTLFDRSCHAPLLIAAPGVKPGVAKGLAEFVDIYPTLADLCGLEPPTGLAGRSLRPLVNDPAAPGKPAAFTVIRRGPQQRGDSVRTDRWRYTEWSDGQRELYDHQTDAEETRNVAEEPDNRAIVEQLSELLRKPS